MDKRFLGSLAIVLAVCITLAIVIGQKLASSGAAYMVLGIATGTAVGIITGGLAGWRVARNKSLPDSNQDLTAVYLSTDQADKLLKIISSREQASPTDFPLTAERERRFTLVGGAHLDNDPDN